MANSPQSRPRILIVDDSEAIHDDFRKVLTPKETDPELDRLEAELFGEPAPKVQQANEYRIDSAFQGQQAAELVRAAHDQGDPYSLAFVDMRMPPGWDGLETIKRLWEIDSRLHVVICTAFSDHPWSEISAAFGATPQLIVLKKPFDAIEALQLATALSAKWDAERLSEVREQELAERAEALAAAHEAAVAALKAKTNFLALMSHEIRTPLNSILGITDLLKEDDPRPGQAAQLEVLRRSGNGLLQLLNGILDLSRIESERLELERMPFSVSQVVEEAIEICALPAHQKRIELALSLPSKTPKVLGDDARLRQVMINLIGNAVKFTKSGGVTVSLSVDEGPEAGRVAVRFAVKDTGIGIPQDRIEEVLEDFTQAEVGITRVYGGTGLGLSLSRKLVAMMDGKLSLESVEGRGTTVTCDIPLDLVGESEAEEIHDASLEGVRILLADDREAERETLAGWLAETGAHLEIVTTSDDTRELLQRCALDAYDVLILAARMNPKGGLALIEAIPEPDRREALAARTTLLFAANRRRGDIESCIGQGVGAWVEKPAKPSALLPALHRIVHGLTAADAADPQPSLDVHSMNILLADDSPDNRNLIEAYLKNSPVQLTLAENGVEAVAAFQKGDFDVVLMDVQMPEMNGLDATRAIRDWERELVREPTPILAVSAFAFIQDRREASEAGCTGHLAKPLSKQTLIHALQEISPRLIMVDTEPELADLVPAYLESRWKDVELLTQQIAEGDFEAVRRLGHNMKGTGRSYGIPKLSEIGDLIEQGALKEDILALRDHGAKLESVLSRIRLPDTEPSRTA